MRTDLQKLVRELFVSYEGKEKIYIAILVYNIYQVEYGNLFETMSSEIEKLLKSPEYANQYAE